MQKCLTLIIRYFRIPISNINSFFYKIVVWFEFDVLSRWHLIMKCFSGRMLGIFIAENTSVIKTLLITLSLFNNYSLIIIAHSTLTAGHRNNKNGSSRSYSNNNIPHQFSNAICHQLHNIQLHLVETSALGIWVEHFARTFPR